VTVRLGYACINVSLQEERSGPRLKSITAKRIVGMDARERRQHLYQVARNNLKTLEAILRWNHRKGIQVFRITSELIPLATHPVAAEWDWEADLSGEFATCADIARQTGIRLTTHPGQYTVLNAKDPEIVERAAADLTYHARMLELLGNAPDWGMVLHVGGAYGDKKAGAARFKENFELLPPQVAERLWIENDDVTWDTEEAYEVAESVGRPMVLDIHHHRLLRRDDWFPWFERIVKGWGSVRPKVHFSSPRDAAKPRDHADKIEVEDFATFLDRTSGYDFDVMLECKRKDRGLLDLQIALRDRV
jgi:UV DNA damage endonuclease